MRALPIVVLLLTSIVLAEEPAVRTVRWQANHIKVSGCQFVSPHQLEREFAWNPKANQICIDNHDPKQVEAQFKDYIETLYRAKGFWDVTASIAAQPDGWLQANISEGPRYRKGAIEVVGAKFLDTQRLIDWLQHTKPKKPDPVVIAIQGFNKPVLQRLPNGQLLRFDQNGVPTTGVTEPAANKGQQPMAAPSAPPNPAPASPPNEFAVASPLWAPGQVCSKDDKQAGILKYWLPLGFSRLGFDHAQFSVDLIPEPQTGTIKLRVQIADEGPPTRVKEIEITGKQAHSREDILRRIDLEIGSRIDATKAVAIEERLADTARFLLHKVTVEPSDDEGQAKVYVDLREQPSVPNLDGNFSETQLLMLKLVNWVNHFRDQSYDVVLTGTVPQKILPQRGPDDAQVQIVVTSKGYLLRLETKPQNGPDDELYLVSHDHWLEFASRAQNRRCRIQIDASVSPTVSIAGLPHNPTSTILSLNIGADYTSEKRGDNGLQLRIDPAAVMLTAVQEVETLDKHRARIAITPSRETSAQTIVVDRDTGRPLEYVIETQWGTFQAVTRKGAFEETLAESRRKAAAFEDASAKPLAEVRLAAQLLQSALENGVLSSWLQADQQALAAATLKRLDFDQLARVMNPHAANGKQESLIDSGMFASIMHFIALGTQGQHKPNATVGLRGWLALSQLLASETKDDPVDGESGLGLQLRDDLSLKMDRVDFSDSRPHSKGNMLLTDLFRNNEGTLKAFSDKLDEAVLIGTETHPILNRPDYGPLSSLLGVSGLLTTVSNSHRVYAAHGIEVLDRFHHDRDALLKPGTASHSLAIFLLDHLRKTPPGERELIASAFNLSPELRLKAAVLWTLLDQEKAKPNEVLLTQLCDVAWNAGLKSVVEQELEQALLRDVPADRHVAVLLDQSTRAMMREQVRLEDMWIDRAERLFEAFTQAIPARKQNAEFEESKLVWAQLIASKRVTTKLAQRNIEDAHVAAQQGLNLTQKLLDAAGDGPAVDVFIESLTKRGKALGMHVMAHENMARVAWHQEGREAALKWLSRADELATELNVPNTPFEAKVIVTSLIVARAKFWACADKNGRCDPDQAKAAARKALEVGGDDYVKALLAAAAAHAAAGEFDEAVQIAQKAQRLANGSTPIFMNAQIQRYKSHLPPIDYLGTEEIETATKPITETSRQ